MPLTLILNACLFLTGHLAVGATVDITVTAGGVVYEMPAYFTFSIAQVVLLL